LDVLKRAIVGEVNDLTHRFFSRYGRGEFKGPSIAWRTGKTISVKGSFTYETPVGEAVASSLKGSEYKVSGRIWSYFPIDDKSKEIKIDGKMSPDEILSIYSRYSEKAFIIISFGDKNTSMRCKKRIPKPMELGEPRFFSAKLRDTYFLENVLTDEEFSSLEKYAELGRDFSLTNTIRVKRIEIPEGITDPEKKRVLSERIGEILRKISISKKGNVIKELFFEYKFRA